MIKKEENIISYSANISSFKTMNEIYGAMFKRKKLIKKTYKKTHTFVYYWILSFIIWFLSLFFTSFVIAIFEDILDIKLQNVLEALIPIFVIAFIIIINTFLWFIISIFVLKHRKKNIKEQTVKIDKNGIEDYMLDFGVKIFCDWDKIKGITFTKSFMLLFTDKPNFFLYYPKDYNIIELIKKHKKELFNYDE